MGKVYKGKQLLTRKRESVRLKSDNVRRLLAVSNKTKTELSKNIGVTATYVNMILQGKRHPSPQMRSRIMRSFPSATWDQLFEYVAH